MKGCDDRMEMLLLDVHGELPPEDLPSWHRHLEACQACRRERDRLLALIGRIRGEMLCPGQTEGETEALARSVSRALRAEREKAAGWKRPFGLRLPPLPALAAACLLVVTLGWFGLHELDAPHGTGSLGKLGAEEKGIVQNLDVLEDLDLLKDMDIIQKLAQVDDERDPA